MKIELYLDIDSGSRVWLYLDRDKEGYARMLAHMWHGPFRVAEKCGVRAVKLEIAGTPYRLFPMILVSKLKLVRVFPERPTSRLNVDEASGFDFDEALLPEDSWEGDLDADEFEVDKIIDVRLRRKTMYGRLHKKYLVQWKEHSDPTWIDEADLNCGARLQEFDRDRVSRNRSEVMQSHKEKAID
uniref:Chromo domain-containing protein n=1 Tax=Hyaloperonospora arabidopsidis (strain Emoy2) TaxID=559515 RepID=M4BNC1_HYAAE